MLGRVTFTLTLAAITAVVIALEASGALAAPKKTAVNETNRIDCVAGKVCKGTSGDDVIIGTKENDNINPFAGNDVVYADPPAGDLPADLLSDQLNIPEGGEDYVHHSYGNDTIFGGPGADTLRGGFGDDTIFGNTPARILEGEIMDKPDGGAPDLVDCAWLASRGDTGNKDVGYGEPKPTDTVVDCSNRDDQ